MLIAVLAAVVAVAAAVRSTWSPCGLSMLSTITPLSERGRNHRFAGTASWFVVGAVVGGATLGLITAALAAGVAAIGLTTTAALSAAAVLALVTGASDLRPFGLQLPFHRRQVNEMWLDQYRPWVYGAGFGWQIGFGLATYIMTAAVYLMIGLAALTANPGVAFGIAVLFGLVRGLAVFLSARLTSHEALLAFHRRFDRLGQPVRLAVIAIQFAVVLVADAAAWGPVALVASGLLIATIVALANLPVGADRRAATGAEPGPTPQAVA